MKLTTAHSIAGWLFLVILAATLPAALSPFQTVQFTVLLIYGLLATSLNFIWGYGGILSFGQAAFFGIGGYVYGIVGGNQGTTMLALLVAIVGPTIVALFIGYFAFYGRIGSTYFSIVTLTVTLILHAVFNSTGGQEYTIGTIALGGFNGMTNIPSLALEVPGRPSEPLDAIQFYYVVCGLVILVCIGVRALLHSSFGRVLVAIRENEKRTELLGYDVRLHKLMAFGISGGIAGLGGGLYAGWGNFMNPDAFGLAQAAEVVIWVIVGGRGALFGPVVGAVLVQYVTNLLGTIFLSQISTVMLGGLLIVVVLFFQKGLVVVAVDAAQGLWRYLAGCWKLISAAV